MTLTGEQYDGSWTVGTMAYEAGWQVRPGATKTFCPAHKSPGWEAEQ